MKKAEEAKLREQNNMLGYANFMDKELIKEII